MASVEFGDVTNHIKTAIDILTELRTSTIECNTIDGRLASLDEETEKDVEKLEEIIDGLDEINDLINKLWVSLG